MSWIHIALPLTVTAGITVALGLPIALALRARGFAVVYLTVPAAFAVLGISPVVVSLLGWDWSITAALLVTAVTTALLALLWPLNRHAASGKTVDAARLRRELAMPLVWAGFGGLMILVLLVRFMWAPDAVSQTYDANFHLNLVSRMLETGNASPFDVDLSNPGNPGFYPALWHAFVALIAQLTGGNVPLATNAAMLFTSAVVWPIGVVALSRALFGPTLRVSMIAGIVSAVVPSVPYTLGSYGVLYPMLLATVLAPYALTALVKILRHGRSATTDPMSQTTAWVLLLGSLGAIGLAQPAGVFAFIIFATPAVAGAVLRGLRHGRGHAFWSFLGGVAYVAIVVTAWYVGRTSDNDWSTRQNFFSAVLEALGGAPRLHSTAWILSLLAVLGLITTFRQKRMRWLGLSWVLSIVFYGIADGFGYPPIRTWLTGPWYNDSWRLGAIAAVASLPLIVFALDRLVAIFGTTMLRLLRQRDATATRPTRLTRSLAAVSSVLMLVFALQTPGLGAVADFVQSKYEPRTDRAPLLDENEHELLETAEQLIPEDATIINNPWNGGSLAEAITGREVLIPHTGGNYPEASYILIDGIAEGNWEACAIAAEENAYWVLDFGGKYVFEGTPRAIPYEGITAIDPVAAPALTERARVGEAVLYEVTGCP